MSELMKLKRGQVVQESQQEDNILARIVRLERKTEGHDRAIEELQARSKGHDRAIEELRKQVAELKARSKKKADDSSKEFKDDIPF